MNKIVFAPCKNNEGNSDEKFEFLVSYDESEFSTNVENLEKCVELYINSKKPVKLSEVETHYMYSEDFKVLDSNISEVIENIHKGEVDIEVIKSKLDEVEKIEKEHRLLIVLIDLQNSPDKKIEKAFKEFSKYFYIKLILKIQQTFEYNDAMNSLKECTICLKEFESGNSVTKLKCGHGFCTECIEKLFEESITCPYCRKNIDIDS